MVREYIDGLQRLTGGVVEPSFFQIREKPGSLYTAHYANVPRPGYLLAFSYGLSRRRHPSWVNASAELLICVNSLDDSWGLAMGDVIARSQPDWTFEYGTVIQFGERIAEVSLMTDFVVYKNCIFSDEQSLIDVQNERIHLSQLYPIYHEELKILKERHPTGFFKGDLLRFCDVHRAPVTFDV